MKAIVFPAPGQIEIQEHPAPICGDEDVSVRALYTLVSSGTELRGLSGKATFPMHPGYAVVGEVIGTGAQVSGYRVGDLVSGRTCKRFIPGTEFTCGGHAEQHVFPAFGEDRAVLLPAPAKALDYIVTELAAISHRGVEAAAPRPGETAVIIGQGLIGALSAAWLRAFGCYVIVVDFETSRLDRALAGWAHAVVNGREAGATARLRAMLDGGADIVVESSGTSGGVGLAYQLVKPRPRGNPYVEGASYKGEAIGSAAGQWPRLVMQATYVNDVTINPHEFFPGEGMTILTPQDRSLDGRQKAVRHLQLGNLKSSLFVDRVMSFREAPEAYRLLRDEKDKVFSVVFDWRS